MRDQEHDMPAYRTDEHVNDVLAEFGDHRKAIAALFRYLDGLAADGDAAVPRGFVRIAAFLSTSRSRA